ncbi:hypothetical protein SFC66_06470 [Terribacillus saccharophilus]|uniref:hypothetical protein n=1 Tax=Terribacillus saccharophilus TaxID=361277 RepID=UPI0039824121
MNKNRIVFLTNAVISGFIAYFSAEFFAAGTIAENYTGQKYVAPEFFIVVVLWGVSFLYGLITTLKFPSRIHHVLAIVFMWIAIPVGFYVGMYLAIRANESGDALASLII